MKRNMFIALGLSLALLFTMAACGAATSGSQSAATVEPESQAKPETTESQSDGKKVPALPETTIDENGITIFKKDYVDPEEAKEEARKEELKKYEKDRGLTDAVTGIALPDDEDAIRVDEFTDTDTAWSTVREYADGSKYYVFEFKDGRDIQIYDDFDMAMARANEGLYPYGRVDEHDDK